MNTTDAAGLRSLRETFDRAAAMNWPMRSGKAPLKMMMAGN